MKEEHLNKIKKAIKLCQKKGFIYYPCNDEELKEEWANTEKMNDEELLRYVESNAISEGW